MNKVAYVGVDYHINGLSVAVLVDKEKDFLDCAHLKNDDKMIRKYLKKLDQYELRLCYEASGSGYAFQRKRRDWGYQCDVIAPALIPKQQGGHEMGDTSVSTRIADAGPAGWIAYSIATWMAWAFLCGFVSSKALLFMACVSLACTIPYMAAAITQLKLGNAADGVTWLYFGAFFALGSALNYGTSFFAIYHWELDASILGYEWAVLAIILILTTPIFVRYAPAAATISIVGADVGLASLSLIYFGYSGAIMLQLSGWSFFVAGLLGIVMAAGESCRVRVWHFPWASR